MKLAEELTEAFEEFVKGSEELSGPRPIVLADNTFYVQDESRADGCRAATGDDVPLPVCVGFKMEYKGKEALWYYEAGCVKGYDNAGSTSYRGPILEMCASNCLINKFPEFKGFV